MAGVVNSLRFCKRISNVSQSASKFHDKFIYSCLSTSPSPLPDFNMRMKTMLLGTGCGVMFGFMLGSYYAKHKVLKINEESNVPFKSQLCSMETNSLNENLNFIADVAEKVAPTVVYIQSTNSQEIFGNANCNITNGSGFIVKSDGLILTNAHVVGSKSVVTVKLHDGRVFSGRVENIDREADLATIKIQAENLPVLPLGVSDNIRLGEFVIALGSPLTLSNTITAGIISAAHRPSRELGLSKECEYIQTDAAINIGNSGGPLVNLKGEAIGINTLKVTEGISFAIPSDRASKFLEKVEKENKSWWPSNKKENVSRFIGISMLTLTPVLLQELRQRNSDFPLVSKGCLIWRLHYGSPAMYSGLKPGDIIVQINGIEISSSSEVRKMVQQNESLEIVVIRDNRSLTFHVQTQIV